MVPKPYTHPLYSLLSTSCLFLVVHWPATNSHGTHQDVHCSTSHQVQHSLVPPPPHRYHLGDLMQLHAHNFLHIFFSLDLIHPAALIYTWWPLCRMICLEIFRQIFFHKSAHSHRLYMPPPMHPLYGQLPLCHPLNPGHMNNSQQTHLYMDIAQLRLPLCCALSDLTVGKFLFTNGAFFST